MKKQILLLLLALTLFTGQIFAIVYANRSCAAYDDCEGEGFSGSGETIGQLTVQGAGYFLKSYSAFLLFLQKVEMAELNGANYQEMQAVLNTAIDNMENAANTFDKLVQTAKERPYNPVVIDKLRNFDYQRYMRDNGLNRVVFMKVKGFLAKGDVTGAYMKLKADMEDIARQMHTVKQAVDANIFPDISQLWRINQAFGNNMAFGQNMAEVFMNL